MKLRIGILGTRGIPNNYGGFEQISGYLAEGLAERGHSVTVYNSHRHPYKDNTWKGVQIVHCFDPEYILGTAGQFVYDLNCIIDARKRNFDAILTMGYTSSSVWGWAYPSKSTIISNMDGLEWKRSKYSAKVQRFLKYAERLAVKYSDAHIADSIGIQQYLQKKYGIDPAYIPYGAEILTSVDEGVQDKFNLVKDDYYLLIARMEPENNIDMILSAFQETDSARSFLVVGNMKNKYGRYIAEKFSSDSRIRFAGPVFDIQTLHSLRHYACLYFHGHSVGGTNPSLLEAMASKSLIAAHSNVFNRCILEDDAWYFMDKDDIKKILDQPVVMEQRDRMKRNNFNKILQEYGWSTIINQYEKLICSACKLPVIEETILHTRYAGE